MTTMVFLASSTPCIRTILLSSASDFGRDDNELAASVRARIVRSAIFLVYEADAHVSAFLLDSEDNTSRSLSPAPHLPRPTPRETTPLHEPTSSPS